MILLLPISLTSPLALPLATVLTCIDLSDQYKWVQWLRGEPLYSLVLIFLIFLKFARHAPTWIYLHLLCLEWPLPRYLHVSLLNLFQESAQTSLPSYVFPDHPFMLSTILLFMCPTSPHSTQTAHYLLYLLTTHTWMETPWRPVFLSDLFP